MLNLPDTQFRSSTTRCRCHEQEHFLEACSGPGAEGITDWAGAAQILLKWPDTLRRDRDSLHPKVQLAPWRRDAGDFDFEPIWPENHATFCLWEAGEGPRDPPCQQRYFDLRIQIFSLALTDYGELDHT
jgi:hypothetical protein